jgi:hypothetical protein
MKKVNYLGVNQRVPFDPESTSNRPQADLPTEATSALSLPQLPGLAFSQPQ